MVPDDLLMRFDKRREYAEPGYYSSELEHQIKIELTSTQRCGMHRYSYSNKHNKGLDIYFLSSYLLQKKAKRSATTTRCGDKCIEGKIFSLGSFGGRFGGYNVHFHLQWSSNNTAETLYFYDSKGVKISNESSGNFSGAILRTKSSNI